MESLVTESNVNNKKCFFTCLYRSQSQSHEVLESFWSSLDFLLSNINDQHPACSIAIMDFNATFSKWCTTDKDNTAGLELDNITILLIVETFGITNMQILKVSKKLFQRLTGLRRSSIETQKKNAHSHASSHLIKCF